MPTKKEILNEQTFPEVEDLAKRIYYVLTEKEEIQLHRIAKGLALTVAHLKKKGIFTDEDLDEFFLDVIP